MAIFTLGNAACALAPNYALLMTARVLTSLAHGTFFGVGSVVATSLVAEDKHTSAISTMFIGLTVVPWPASKEIIKQLINHNFVDSQNREYHQVYQVDVSQFRFESGSGLACKIRSHSGQFPVSPVVSSKHVGEPMSSVAARLYGLSNYPIDRQTDPH